MLWELAAEVLGTFILILLGDGVVANVGLAPRLAAGGYNWNTITIGWCFAVVIAAYATGGVSAHLNPAVTLAMAVKRNFPWSKVIPFWVAQVVGAFLGALAVFLCYRDGLVAAGMPNVWTTGPGSVFGQAFWGGGAGQAAGQYALITAVITEIFGTAILLFGICSADKVTNNLGTLLVGFAVLAAGLSLGGPSGYSLNPARDFGPRLLGVLVGTQGLFDGIYWLVAPVIAPFIGAVGGIYVYDWVVTAGLAAKKAEEAAVAKGKAGRPAAQA
ncbi:MAG TPA: MIP/aquaporin family protein [Chloroflexota bacterium]|nr:MIP/aquaporin family protein [Chloroflexota bacterium]